MSKDEKSLLLFFECRIVDKGGRVNSAHMNNADRNIANRWADEKFIRFGRIAIEDCDADGSLWVTFSDEAWETAHKLRRDRGERMLRNRSFRTTEEGVKGD